MIQFTCSQCQESLEAPLSLEGDNLTCPQCGYQQKIPAPSAGESEKDPYIIEEEEPAVEEAVDPKGPRPIMINSIGEIIMTKDNKSVSCPVQEHRCRYNCAWFSIDHDANNAMCQGRIVIGVIQKNEYGKEDGKKNRWG